ncbi:MAG TPA: phosphate ABC transporter substrate-binding protein PstS [Burkholderiaceae bacterium]
MTRVLPAAIAALALSLSALSPARAADTITGAGSSAAAPVYRIWADEYAKSQRGAAIAYEPVGSGAGMARIQGRAVDFGASDFISSPAELKKHDLVMFPTVITGVVPVVNLPGVASNALHLTGDVLGRIYTGRITQWNAPEIKALNPDLKLPAHPIRLIARADGSGTTYHFSDYLSRTCADWKAKYGVASHFDWIAGTLAVKGSGEVSKAVRATPDALSYIDYNYMVDDDLTAVSMRNAAGRYVTADVEGFREAVMHSAWYSDGDFSGEINDLPGQKTWPITMGTYIAIPRVAPAGARTEGALRFITWAYLHGDSLARQARFVPLPEKVQASAYREISRVSGAHGELLGARLMGNLLD